MTHYEYQLQQEEERAKREKNLKDLNAKLTEAKDLYTTIETLEKTFENEQARRDLWHEIKRLETLIEDERNAYNSTFEAHPNDVEKVIDQMAI